MTLWGGRFSGKLHPDAWAFNASISTDRRLAQQDVRASIAWADALKHAGVLAEEECSRICQGLRSIAQEFEAGGFAFHESDEDIHTAVERRLEELIGPTAGKLHTGRSRNDQVATDFRLWMLDSVPVMDNAITGLQGVLVERAVRDGQVILPGYTHLQRAQPITLSHWWLSHFWPLQRDRERLDGHYRRTAVLPLGCGALAGTPFPVGRAALAEALGFLSPSPNSLDAVSDRDFAAEFLFCTALLGTHISRLAEAVVLFTTAEFGFFELSDAYATGSSLMPQKKNPDVFELARGKAGTLTGLLVGLLTALKGLPSTYDKDLQEDKAPVFMAFDILMGALPVLSGALDTLTLNEERMREAIDPGLLATDLADYLVERGLPFRQAHNYVGKVVRMAEGKGVSLAQLDLEQLRSPCPQPELIQEDVYEVFDPLRSITRRSAVGGAAPRAVAAQLEQAKTILHSWRPSSRATTRS